MVKPIKNYSSVALRIPKEMDTMLRRVAKKNCCSLSYVIKMALMDVYPLEKKD